MSSNRLNYDTCQYKQKLAESISVGNYMLNVPPIACDSCYPYPPSIRLQRQGDSVSATQPLIDVDSELIGITRPASKCPSRKFIPKCPYCKCDVGEPCGNGVISACKSCQEKLKTGQMCGSAGQLKHFKDCDLFSAEETRMSNPPCNLRGSGLNRWEWLCMNPQERVEVPFDWNVSNRIIVKDNHRPCLPTPIDPTLALPKYADKLPCVKLNPNICANIIDPPSTTWQSCKRISEL